MKKKPEAPKLVRGMAYRKKDEKDALHVDPAALQKYRKEMEAMTTPVTGQKFILDQLNRFEWAITAVQVQPTPQHMERMIRAIFRTAWLVFIMAGDDGKPETQPSREAINTAERTYARTYISIERINWQLFFDRVKGTKRFYTMPEACELLGLVRQTIVKYINRGDLQAVKAGSGWRFPIETIENYLEKQWEKGKQ